jgi:CRISPR-associated protein Csm1
MPDFSVYRALWKQPAEGAPAVSLGYPGWPESGVAVMGDFSGIQSFVFRPVPGAGGAARRLRSRSFRVSAYAEMIMRWCLAQLSEGRPKTLYAAGGKFLIGSSAFAGWESALERMQSELDRWAWRNFGGELIFHLTAASFESGKVPYAALQQAMEDRRNRPLAKALLSPHGWASDEFFERAASGDGKCDACVMTRQVYENSDQESVCEACTNDEDIGKKLPRARFAYISPNAREDVAFLDSRMELCDTKATTTEGDWLAFGAGTSDAQPWYLFRHVPKNSADLQMDFDEIADTSAGTRKWLGYLRIDGDGAGKHFNQLQGNACGIWALSSLLNSFFADTANGLVSDGFTNIYPVYGGGDDLFVVGPWNEVLDFALELRLKLKQAVGDDLTFSAGVSLSKPKEHVLTQAKLALRELETAKKEAGHGRSSSIGRDQIRALGVTADWDTFAKLLPAAKKVTEWAEAKEIPSSFLHQMLQLHQAWKKCQKTSNGRVTAKLVRYKPLLHYQIQRNLKEGEAQKWAHGLLQPESLWPWADFIARYAMLATRHEKKE